MKLLHRTFFPHRGLLLAGLAWAAGCFTMSDAVAESPPIGDFRLGWKPGATYRQTLVVTQKVGIPFRGSADANTNLTLKLTPQGPSGKAGRSLAMKLEHFKTLIDMPLPKTNEKFDSATPAEGNRDIASFYEQFQALPLKATLDGKGQITALHGMEALESENPLVERFLGKEQVAALFRQGWFLSLPAKAIGVGESWPYKLAFPTPIGSLKMEGSYTLLGHETRGTMPCWKLQLKGTMTAPPPPLPKPSPETKPAAETPKTETAGEDKKITEAEIQEKLAKLGLVVRKATMEGFIWFNPVEQLIHDSEITTDIKIGLGNATPDATGPAKPMEIPITQKLVLELRKL